MIIARNVRKVASPCIPRCSFFISGLSVPLSIGHSNTAVGDRKSHAKTSSTPVWKKVAELKKVRSAERIAIPAARWRTEAQLTKRRVWEGLALCFQRVHGWCFLSRVLFVEFPWGQTDDTSGLAGWG